MLASSALLYGLDWRAARRAMLKLRREALCGFKALPEDGTWVWDLHAVREWALRH